MFGKLNQYIILNFFWTLGFFVFGLMGMLWLVQSVGLIENVLLYGESVGTFLRLSLNFLPNNFMIAAPLAALGATIFMLNQMASNAEISVMQGAGIRPTQIASKIIYCGLILTALLYAFTLYITPNANRALRVEVRTIQTNFSNNVVTGGRFLSPVEGITIFANQSLDSGEMLDVFIEDRRQAGIISSYFAKRGLVIRENGLTKLALFDGEVHESDRNTSEYGRAFYGRMEVVVGDDRTIDEAHLAYWSVEQPTKELIDRFMEDPQSAGRERQELSSRFSFPLLGFILPGIAAMIFLSAPYSRSGYVRPSFFAGAMGIFIAAIQLAIPSIAANSLPSMIVMILPFAIFLGVMVYARGRTK